MNHEHYSLIRREVEEWNRWREENPGVKPDLKGADLRGIWLRSANLRDTDLSGADLSEANLYEASLARAKANEANFRRANLSGAFLKGGSFLRANFTEADLTEAVLQGVPSREGNILDAIEGGTWFEDAIFDQADMEWVHGQGGMFSRATFKGARMPNALLNAAQLSGGDLSKTDLSEANLSGGNLTGVRLNEAVLKRAMLDGANLNGADFRSADFTDASLRQATLLGVLGDRSTFYRANLFEARFASRSGASLVGADLREAQLDGADLSGANLTSASLQGANLSRAIMVETCLEEANLSGCRIYGISAWQPKLDRATQMDLVITPPEWPTVSVDNLEVAQFVFLLLANAKIRSVIDTVGKKAILILGRFTIERKLTLDILKEELRKRGFVPILFDFQKPEERDLTETVSTLAHLVRFIIADLTDAKSIPQELQKIIPNLPSVPVQPIILDSQSEYAMFNDFAGYMSVLPPYRYKSTDELLASLESRVISPAIRKVQEIAERRKEFEQQSE